MHVTSRHEKVDPHRSRQSFSTSGRRQHGGHTNRQGDHVADGDTITVLDDSRTQHVIRLSGIDSPEKRQPFGTKAKQHLSGLVASQTVTVEFKKRDRYQRIVGKITLNGTDICLEQIRAGLAWHYKKYAKEQPEADRAVYEIEEDAARTRQIGLWSDPYPVPPWDFRKPKVKVP